MQRRITITLLTLCLIAGLTLWSATRGTQAKGALDVSSALDPNSFTSLGEFPTLGAGDYFINTSKDNANPVLTQSDGVTVIATGVFYDPTPGDMANRDELAVFTFDSINIPAGVTIYGLANANSRPAALLSKNSITLDGVIKFNGGDGHGNGASFIPPPPDPGRGGAAGPGGGGGGGGGGGWPGGAGYVAGNNGAVGQSYDDLLGGDGGSVSANGGGKAGDWNTGGSGGGFGGKGGRAECFSCGPLGAGAGGVAYGDLTVRLQGGSGGAGGAAGGGGGGGGGGAIELGALANITITGSVQAQGGRGGDYATFWSGGGGAGGAILIHGQIVNFSYPGSLIADGGVDGEVNTNGGGGGGGRVSIVADTVYDGIVNVGGGYSRVGEIGDCGVYTTIGTVIPDMIFGFVQQPVNSTPGRLPAVTVAILNKCNQLDTHSNAPITLALGDNPGGATLGGTLTKTPVNGVVTFNDLTINRPGTGYTLVASSNSGTIGRPSNSFDIVCSTITLHGVEGQSPTCNGANNGFILDVIDPEGGVGPYQYSIDNGQTFDDGNGFFPNLAAGVYQFVARDASGCLSNVRTLTLTEPPAITFTTTPVNPTCSGASNGQLTINASGGTGVFQYSINNGATYQASNVFNNLAADSYQINVKDANSCPTALACVVCTASQAVSLTADTLPPPTITPGGSTMFCAGGSVTLTSNSASGNQWYLDDSPISGATSQSYNATVAGHYTVQVTTSGCTSPASAATTVTANTAPTLVYATPQLVTFGGSLNITATTATDDVSITGYSVLSVVPALMTAPTVNSAGMVSITDAQPAGSHVITIRATDSCEATTDASFTVNVSKGNQTITFNVLANKTFGDPDFTVNAMASSGLLVSLAASGNCTVTGSSPGTAHITGAGSCTITASQAGNANYNTASDVARTFSIAKAITSMVLTASPSSVQYSDPITLRASMISVSGDALIGSVEFFIDDFPVGVAAVDSSRVASSFPVINYVPGMYSVTAKFTSPNVNFTDCTGGPYKFTILQEDSRATYNGNNLFWTSSVTSNNASATLSATVQDIAIVDPNQSPPNPDNYSGDIRNAKVTFMNRDTNTPLAGCSDLPVGMVKVGDTTTGIATCNTTLSLSNGNNSGGTQFTIGTVVSGYYTRNSTDDDTVVTLAQPIESNFITGGGSVTLRNSAGLMPGAVGSKSNFGFNVKYNKNGTNLQGNVDIMVRNSGHTYKIKGNVLLSLGVFVKHANFTGKASIQDVTDPNNPISIDGNATLQMWMTDNSALGISDTLGIQVLNKNGGLWFSSNWDGAKTSEQNLDAGHISVR